MSPTDRHVDVGSRANCRFRALWIANEAHFFPIDLGVYVEASPRLTIQLVPSNRRYSHLASLAKL